MEDKVYIEIDMTGYDESDRKLMLDDLLKNHIGETFQPRIVEREDQREEKKESSALSKVTSEVTVLEECLKRLRAKMPALLLDHSYEIKDICKATCEKIEKIIKGKNNG